jgi:hypothetical protein
VEVGVARMRMEITAIIIILAMMNIILITGFQSVTEAIEHGCVESIDE